MINDAEKEVIQRKYQQFRQANSLLQNGQKIPMLYRAPKQDE